MGHNAVIKVFDSVDLRKKIIFHLLMLKERDRLYDEIKDLVSESIQSMWFLYCKCELCTLRVHDYYNGI